MSLGLAERARGALQDAEASRHREPEVAPLFRRRPSLDRLGRFPPRRGVAGIALEPFAPPPREWRRGSAASLLREIPAAGVEGYHGRITGFLEDLDRWRRRGERIILVARSEAQGRRLEEILRDHDLGARLGRELPEPGGIGLWIGELTAGFRIA